MNIEKLDKDLEAQWETFIDNEKNSRFQHLLKFKKVIEKTYKNCEERYYFIKNRAIFPFFLVKSTLLGNRLISLPFLDNGGFLGNYTQEEIKDLLKLLKKEKNIRHIEVRLNSSFENIKQDDKIFTNLGFVKDSSKQQSIIKLKSEEKTWKNFHKHTRNDIRKAEKSGLTSRKIKDEQELKKFYKLYAQNMKYFGTPQHSYAFFQNFFKIMKENVIGFNCYYKNDLAGSIILFYNGQQGYIPYNVSEPKYRQYRPNDLLYWEMIKLAIKKGVKYLDLGQIDKNSSDQRAIGLYKFKRKWLGYVYDRIYFYYDLEKKEDKKGKKDKLKKFRSTWKKIPSPILKKLGPKIASQLGI